MTKAILQTIITIILLISAGVMAKKFELLKKEDSLILNKVLIYLALPALAFTAIRNAQLSFSLLAIPLISYLIMLGTGLLGLFLAYLFKFPRIVTGSLLLGGVLGNTAFMGYPVIISIYGQQNLVKAVFYNELGTVIFMFIMGSFIGALYGKGEISWKNILQDMISFPPLIALVLAFLTKPLPLPALLLDVLHYFSQLTIPLVMITVGLSLDFQQIKQGSTPLFLALFLKLVFSPLLACLVGHLGGLDATTWGITALEAAMPVSMVSLSFAIKYELDVDFTSNLIFTSVLVSILTLPLLGLFLPS